MSQTCVPKNPICHLTDRLSSYLGSEANAAGGQMPSFDTTRAERRGKTPETSNAASRYGGFSIVHDRRDFKPFVST
jgi:hypothetical protein